MNFEGTLQHSNMMKNRIRDSLASAASIRKVFQRSEFQCTDWVHMFVPLLQLLRYLHHREVATCGGWQDEVVGCRGILP